MKKIGVIGSGPVGRVLATGFLKKGHEVMIGSREPAKLEDWKKENENGNIGTFKETAEFGELLVLAVVGSGAESALEGAGISNLEGKIIIDTTNPISNESPENGVLKYFTNLDSSLMEQLQTKFPQARFVKAFSCIGNAIMIDPQYKDGKPTMFICGNEEGAKAEVSEILDQFGWEIEDMGSATAARAIEPMAILWCIPGFLRNQWNHAFKLLKM